MSNHGKLPIPASWPGGTTHFVHQIETCRRILPNIITDADIGDPVGGFEDAMLHLELAANLVQACDKTLRSVHWNRATAKHKRQVWRSVLQVYAIVLPELKAFYEWFNPWLDYLMAHPKFYGNIGVIAFDAQKSAALDLPVSPNRTEMAQYVDSKVLLPSLAGLKARTEQFAVYAEQLQQFPAETD
jgi:hypothetical protein